jgi:hypothetical protein
MTLMAQNIEAIGICQSASAGSPQVPNFCNYKFNFNLGHRVRQFSVNTGGVPYDPFSPGNCLESNENRCTRLTDSKLSGAGIGEGHWYIDNVIESMES